MTQPESDAETLKRLHGMFARRVQDRRMEILGLFEDHAASHWAGPGHVTVNQFCRAIDLLGFRLNRKEMTALCSVYCDTDIKHEFNYVEFCAEVDPIFGRDGRKKGRSEAFEKYQEAMKGKKEDLGVPGNPYFDQFGQVKPFSKPLNALSPRTAQKDKALLRAGFQPVGANIVNGGQEKAEATRPLTPYADKAPDLRSLDLPPPQGAGGNTEAAGLAFNFDHGQMIGVQAEGVDDDIARIQAQVFRRRIRTKEFFKHWDKAGTGRVTREQFSRGIANIIYPNTFYDPETPIDIEALIDHFTDYSPEVTEPTVVNYSKFCEVMDGVFNKHRLENRPTTSVPKPGAGVIDAGGFAPRAVRDEEGLRKLLRRIANLVEVHGIELSCAFNDCQRSDADIRTGRISADQFIRHFPLAKSTPTQPAYLKRPDMEMMIQRYTDDNGWVRIFAFIGDIEEIQKKKPKMIERRTANTKGVSKWGDHNSISTIVGKLGL
jgi:hypothetical protein